MREQTANQARASSSPPSHHPAGSSSITDGRTLDNMLVASPFENTVISPPSTHSMHPTDRRPPLKVPHPSDILKCPRCDSLDTKFCYYNNYSLTQPRYFCKNCKRYWTAGGALRNVPVGGGLRKNKRSKLKLAAEAEAAMGTAQAISFVAAGSTGAGQHHYHGQGALATSATVRPTADSLPNVENRAVAPMGPAVALPSGNIYAQYNSGAPALNYDTSSHYRRSNVRASSEHEQAGKINYGGNDHRQELGSFYSEPSSRPQVQAQFYSGCVGSEEYTGHGHHGFSNVSEDYMVNYNFMEEVVNPSNGCEEAVSANNNSGGSKDEGGGEMSGHEKDEGGPGDGNNNNSNSYDSWQLLSEGLNIFNGGGSENNAGGHGNLFFNMPSSSWPDFSQFNSTSGPG